MISTRFCKRPEVLAFLILAIVFSLLLPLFAPCPVSAITSPTLYEYNDTGDNGTAPTGIYSSNVTYQTFSTNTTTVAHTISSVKLMMMRSGTTPGTVRVSIRATAAGLPTGGDIAYAELNGDTFSTDATWYEFTDWVYYEGTNPVNVSEFGLTNNITYALVVQALGGTSANFIQMRWVSTGSYIGGNAGYSTSGGVAWTANTASDFMFQIWGRPCLEIQDIKVFESYLVDHDWLIVIRYINIYPPYYDTYDVKRYFQFNLLDTTNTTRASTSVVSWGNSVGSIYLSASTAASLGWETSYLITMNGTFAGNPVVIHTLSSSDWLGIDMSQLDSWVLSSAAAIQNYYPGITLTTYVNERGEVLNSTGSTLFSTGITGLTIARPNLFQIYTSPGTATEPNVDTAYRTSLKAWQTAWGPDGTAMLTNFGNMIGVSGGVIGGIFFLLPMFALMIWAFRPGSSIAASILTIPVLYASVYFGTDLLFIAILALIAAFLFVKQLWIDK